MATAGACLIRIWCTILFRATSRRDPDGRHFVRKPTGPCPAAGTKRAGPSGSLNAADQPQGLLRVSIRHLGDTERHSDSRVIGTRKSLIVGLDWLHTWQLVANQTPCGSSLRPGRPLPRSPGGSSRHAPMAMTSLPRTWALSSRWRALEETP